jgi:hypothetical protein
MGFLNCGCSVDAQVDAANEGGSGREAKKKKAEKKRK